MYYSYRSVLSLSNILYNIIQLPAGCDYQVAVIELNVSHKASNTTVIDGPFEHPYANGVMVSLTISISIIQQDKEYEVIIVVETEGGITSSAPYTFCEYIYDSCILQLVNAAKLHLQNILLVTCSATELDIISQETPTSKGTPIGKETHKNL